MATGFRAGGAASIARAALAVECAQKRVCLLAGMFREILNTKIKHPANAIGQASSDEDLKQNPTALTAHAYRLGIVSQRPARNHAMFVGIKRHARSIRNAAGFKPARSASRIDSKIA
ncbi:hypothetical protein [Paracoccus ravus]|uniref:hypothetical protein n=1 Tax=Paracoccus ravus TaxID=2447760 RepID=UPI00106EBF3E|nr:hypothetical protein [Paracoccus ravus]